MKKTKNINWSNQASKTMLLGAAMTSVALAAQLARADNGPDNYFDRTKAGDVFVIALENHNLTQPNPLSSPEQIQGNAAAPYLNSLMTPGNPNAAQVSYAKAYYNTGVGVHPSEPNYVWAESGSDFGYHSDDDPNTVNGNTFYYTTEGLISQVTTTGGTFGFWHHTFTPHLVQQLNEAGIPWKDYQEDIQLSLSPTNSATGVNGPTNIYNGSTQYSYAVKHNPMALFGDSALENVYPIAQLFSDLNDNTVGRYNWITPDQYNEAHSSLNAGFTYMGTHYTGDQAAIAEADNFLSIVLPEIMASKAYKDNGVIVLWWDETEGGDNGSYTLPEIIISPLAKGNAYASTVSMSHSSDLKTWEELFGLPMVNNPIPSNETNFDGSFNNVATANDLSDLFVPDAIPAAPSLSVNQGSFIPDSFSHSVRQTVHITNTGSTPVFTPLFLALDNLSSDATLVNSDGTTQVLAPLNSPCVQVPLHTFGGDVLQPHQTVDVTLQFLDPSAGSITYTPRLLNVTPAP